MTNILRPSEATPDVTSQKIPLIRTLTMDSTMLAMLADGLTAGEHIRYAYGSSLVLAVIESIACLPDEIALIWSKWSLVNVLYIFSRYFIFFPGILAIQFAFAASKHATPQLCKTQFSTLTASTILCITIAEALLYIRVHAIVGSVYGRKIPGILLGLVFMGLHVGIFVNLGKFLETVEYTPSPIRDLFPCWLTSQNERMLASGYFMVLACELVIVLVTLWVCITGYRSSKSPIISSFYKDGLGYFVLLSIISVGNILCHLLAPASHKYLLAIPQGVLHSVLSTRMVLHLRKAARKDTERLEGSDASFSIRIGSESTGLSTSPAV